MSRCLEIIPFKAEHIREWVDQPENSFLEGWLESGSPSKLEENEHSVSGVWDGQVMVCGGVTEYWPGRCEIWAVFNVHGFRSFVPVFRGVKAWLETLPYSRIELSIPTDSPQKSIACRRAKLLGFELDALCLKKYLPGEQDAILWSLVKEVRH